MFPPPKDVVVAPAGLTLGSSFIIGNTVFKQWVSGGTVGVTYKVTVTCTTNAGRVKQVEFTVKIKDD